MKKYILFFLLIAGIITGIFITSCDNDVPDVSTTLVCLGDSLTAGYGATTPGYDDASRSYPAFLQNKVTIPVINAGKSGNTTAQALARVDKDVLSHNPQIVIIILGANDVFQFVSPTTTKANLQQIINKINNGSRQIYLAKFYTEEIARQMVNSLYPGLLDSETLQNLIESYDDMFDTLTAPSNVTLIENFWEGVWEVHMSDNVHPDAEGYEIMSNNIFEEIKHYLQAHGLLKIE